MVKNENGSRRVIEAASRFTNEMPGRLKGGNGDGTSDGMEARIAKLEAAVEHIQRDIGEIRTDVRSLRDNGRSDFRTLFGAIIAVALGLAGLMAKGFHWF
jgi:hypothetical protein